MEWSRGEDGRRERVVLTRYEWVLFVSFRFLCIHRQCVRGNLVLKRGFSGYLRVELPYSIVVKLKLLSIEAGNAYRFFSSYSF